MILVVHDDMTTLRDIRYVLEAAGFAVLTAASRWRALQFLAEITPRVVVAAGHIGMAASIYPPTRCICLLKARDVHYPCFAEVALADLEENKPETLVHAVQKAFA